jgi:hypothetical protein
MNGTVGILLALLVYMVEAEGLVEHHVCSASDRHQWHVEA